MVKLIFYECGRNIDMLVIAIVMVMHGVIVGGIFSMIYRVAECGLC